MGQYAQRAPQVGFGTTKVTGATLASQSLLTALSLAAFPDGCSGVDIEVVTGTLYWDNDGTAATANDRTLGVGSILEVSNSPEILKSLRIFANATVDIRISLNG